MDTNQSLVIPDWVRDLIADPIQCDSEWGRSCRYCDSSHGKYDQALEHYIDCEWLRAAEAFDLAMEGHAVYEPKPCGPCEVCGWYYNSKEEWRGREMPEPAGPELQKAHDTHIAEEHGITLEEYYAGPPRTGGFDIFMNDGPMAWHMKWGWYSLANSLPKFTAERGGISFATPPELS